MSTIILNSLEVVLNAGEAALLENTSGTSFASDAQLAISASTGLAAHLNKIYYKNATVQVPNLNTYLDANGNDVPNSDTPGTPHTYQTYAATMEGIMASVSGTTDADGVEFCITTANKTALIAALDAFVDTATVAVTYSGAAIGAEATAETEFAGHQSSTGLPGVHNAYLATVVNGHATGSSLIENEGSTSFSGTFGSAFFNKLFEGSTAADGPDPTDANSTVNKSTVSMAPTATHPLYQLYSATASVGTGADYTPLTLATNDIVKFPVNISSTVRMNSRTLAVDRVGTEAHGSISNSGDVNTAMSSLKSIFATLLSSSIVGGSAEVDNVAEGNSSFQKPIYDVTTNYELDASVSPNIWFPYVGATVRVQEYELSLAL